MCTRVLHQARVHDLLTGLSFPLLFHSWFIFLQQCVALDWYLVGVSLSFQDMCFCNQVWGYDMPHIYSFRYSYPLTVMFSSIYILGTMCDSSLGVWKNETLSNILLCYL
jgi:hypothetical protein